MQEQNRSAGMVAALLTPISMGIIPIFAKLSINSGMDAFTVASLRTVIAAVILWIVFLIFARQYTYIFPAGLLGTIAVGATNGLGSLLYYNGLEMLNNASLAQLLFLQYSFFTIFLSLLIGEKVTKLSIIRCVLALFAVVLLTINGNSTGELHWVGVGLIIGGGFLYALHVMLSQRVMFEMPAPTMTLYALTSMGITVLIARIIAGTIIPLSWSPAEPIGWVWLVCLAVFTGLSRLSLFTGVRNLGSLQTILMNMADIGVTLIFARIFLHEMLTGKQWIGVAILMLSVILSHWESENPNDAFGAIRQPKRLRSKKSK